MAAGLQDIIGYICTKQYKYYWIELHMLLIHYIILWQFWRALKMHLFDHCSDE